MQCPSALISFMRRPSGASLVAIACAASMTHVSDGEPPRGNTTI
jgi:hypothetical protein